MAPNNSTMDGKLSSGSAIISPTSSETVVQGVPSPSSSEVRDSNKVVDMSSYPNSDRPSLNPRIPQPNISIIHCPPQTQLEMEENSRKRFCFKKPCNHDLKKCILSFQYLPPKTRQTIRILTITLASVLALVAIFYIARIAEKSHHVNSITVEHEIDEQLQFQLGGGSFMGGRNRGPKLEYNVEEDTNENGKPPKIVKDVSGKAHFSGKTAVDGGFRLPIVPKRPANKNGKGPKMTKKSRNRKMTEEDKEATLKLVQNAVNRDRKLITNKELKFWEKGSEPLRVLLLSTWRSGSTFLAQVLQSHPGVYEHYEPFSYFGIRQIRSGKDAFQSQQLLHRLLDCEYNDLDEYNSYLRKNPKLMVSYNKKVWQSCRDGPNHMTCSEPEFLSEACNMFPIQLVKTVRLRLNITQLLLNDHKLKVKVIFLVRDPRGTMNSRYSSVDWCTGQSDCASPETLCSDLEGDLKVAKAFEHLYPNRFLQVQYENLATDSSGEVERIMNFLELDFTKEMQLFVSNNTQSNFDKPWSIKRKSVERVDLWKKQLPLEEIHTVQNACGSVLKKLNLELL